MDKSRWDYYTYMQICKFTLSRAAIVGDIRDGKVNRIITLICTINAGNVLLIALRLICSLLATKALLIAGSLEWSYLILFKLYVRKVDCATNRTHQNYIIMLYANKQLLIRRLIRDKRIYFCCEFFTLKKSEYSHKEWDDTWHWLKFDIWNIVDL